MNPIMNLRVPQQTNFSTTRVTVSFPRRTLLHGVSSLTLFRSSGNPDKSLDKSYTLPMNVDPGQIL
jgi:hypothetical protein